MSDAPLYQQQMTTEEYAEAEEWLRTRPPAVLRQCLHYPPGALYRMKSTGHIVPLYALTESDDGSCTTCQVLVLNLFNPNVIVERRVFGVELSDLEIHEMLPRALQSIALVQRILTERGEL